VVPDLADGGEANEIDAAGYSLTKAFESGETTGVWFGREHPTPFGNKAGKSPGYDKQEIGRFPPVT
jgi:hypothetical protein